MLQEERTGGGLNKSHIGFGTTTEHGDIQGGAGKMYCESSFCINTRIRGGRDTLKTENGGTLQSPTLSIITSNNTDVGWRAAIAATAVISNEAACLRERLANRIQPSDPIRTNTHRQIQIKKTKTGRKVWIVKSKSGKD